MRTLKIYGESIDAVYNVFINDKKYESDESSLIYSFSTDTSLHDSYNIKLEVITGTVILKKCLVDYPAKINGKEGKVTFDQPIETPLYKLIGKELIPQPFDIIVEGKSTVEFEQLMFNGPTYLDVELSSNIKYKDSLYIGNLLKTSFIPEIKMITPIYKYNKQRNNIHNKQDLAMLKEKVLTRILT